ncbi:MAG: hypothetical protein ACRD0A_12275 [Acidimicrobiales bacterium]
MLISCWSAKGGVGTTVVAAALAVHLARREPAGVLALDLAGDLPIALGCPMPAGPALADWLAGPGDVPTDAIARLEHAVSPGLSLVHRGPGPLAPARGPMLARLLASEPRPVVADCGLVDSVGEPSVGRAVAEAASSSLLVTRPCFLAVRRAVQLDLRPTGVVLVVEDGRAITSTDIEGALNVPVVATVRMSPAVARAVDAGLLISSLPRSLQRDLEHAA